MLRLLAMLRLQAVIEVGVEVQDERQVFRAVLEVAPLAIGLTEQVEVLQQLDVVLDAARLTVQAVGLLVPATTVAVTHPACRSLILTRRLYPRTTLTLRARTRSSRRTRL